MGPKNGGWGQRGSTWGVTWHWLMGGACTLGSFVLGSLGDLCIHWVDLFVNEMQSKLNRSETALYP